MLISRHKTQGRDELSPAWCAGGYGANIPQPPALFPPVSRILFGIKFPLCFAEIHCARCGPGVLQKCPLPAGEIAAYVDGQAVRRGAENKIGGVAKKFSKHV
jgi:hypothetical protein